MASDLSAPEPEAGTYMESQTVNWLIKNRLDSDSPDHETARIWNTILNLYFPLDSGYSTGFEEVLNTKSTELSISQLVLSYPADEYKFYIIEYKTPDSETGSEVWKKGWDQLNEYLGAVAEKNEKRIFGAIAAGRVVRFYEWNREAGKADNLVQDDTYFYIDRHCQTVVRYLVYIRDHSL